MSFGRKFDILLLLLSLVFVLAAIYFALVLTSLVPTDVSTVVHSSDPSKYEDLEHRIKGVVEDWSGNNTFNLTDVVSPDELTVVHKGSFPSDFSSGKTVFITGVLKDSENMVISSSKIEIDSKNPKTSGGWLAPYAQKIFYFHVSAAWVSFLAFGVVFASSILFLKKPQRKWDTLAVSSAEIGVVFCTLAIATGPIWGKAEWGVYWRWEDTKLTITFILWLIFVSYLILRGGVESESKSRLAAVFGIIGFVCVPLSFISSRIWQSMHPNVVATSEGSLAFDSMLGLLLGVIAFTFVFFFMLKMRVRIQNISHRIDDLKDKIGGI